VGSHALQRAAEQEASIAFGRAAAGESLPLGKVYFQLLIENAFTVVQDWSFGK